MRKSCYFNNGESSCSALTVKCCPKGCAFYKTKEQFEQERQKALQRIEKLGVGNHVYISEKYYGGSLLPIED